MPLLLWSLSLCPAVESYMWQPEAEVTAQHEASQRHRAGGSEPILCLRVTMSPAPFFCLGISMERIF